MSENGADREVERARLTAPIGDLSTGHCVTLRVLAETPDHPNLEGTWSGRLQGMAMLGLCWRFPGKPWQISRYGQALVDAADGTEPEAPGDDAAAVDRLRAAFTAYHPDDLHAAVGAFLETVTPTAPARPESDETAP